MFLINYGSPAEKKIYKYSKYYIDLKKCMVIFVSITLNNFLQFNINLLWSMVSNQFYFSNK